MTFATCHSPFDESARGMYSRNAVIEGGKRGTDCIIGDMNTYGNKASKGDRERIETFAAIDESRTDKLYRSPDCNGGT